MDGGAIRKGVGEDIGNNSTEETAEVGRLEGGGVADCAGKADGFEWFVLVVEFDKRVDTSWEFGGKVVMEGVEAAVEAGAGVE